jgi:hypothetical protein
MTSIFQVIPKDVFVNWIVTAMPSGTTRLFCRVSKTANAIVKAAAEAPQPDINLALQRETVVLDGSIASLLRQKIKMEFLKSDMLTVISYNYRTDKRVCSSINVGECLYPSISQAISRYRRHYPDRNPNSIIDLTKIKGEYELSDCDLAIALVAFDFNTNLIRSGCSCFTKFSLEYVLNKAVHDLNAIKFIPIVRAHPKAGLIEAHGGKLTLEACLCNAISVRKNPEIVKLILSFPNAKHIRTEAFNVKFDSKPMTAYNYGFGDALKDAIETNNPEMVRALHTANIPAEGPHGLRAAIEKVVWAEPKNPELLEALTSHPNASGIRAEGLYGNRNALDEALNSSEVIQALEELKIPEERQ